MQDSVSLAAASAVRGGVDLRSTRRYLAAVMLIAGPLLIAALRVLVPYGAAGNTADTLAAVRAHPSAEQAILLLGPIGGIAMVLATLSLMRLISRQSPVLAAIGGVVALAGWAMVPMLSASDALAGAIANQPSAGGAALYDAFFGSSAVTLMFSVFMTGHIFGMLLLGAAMLRARVTPVWAGIAVIAGTILHPLAFVVLGSHLLDGGSYVVIGAGFAAAAAAVCRADNAHWDLPAEPRGSQNQQPNHQGKIA